MSQNKKSRNLAHKILKISVPDQYCWLYNHNKISFIKHLLIRICVVRIEARAKSYQRQIPEKFRFWYRGNIIGEKKIKFC